MKLPLDEYQKAKEVFVETRPGEKFIDPIYHFKFFEVNLERSRDFWKMIAHFEKEIDTELQSSDSNGYMKSHYLQLKFEATILRFLLKNILKNKIRVLKEFKTLEAEADELQIT